MWLNNNCVQYLKNASWKDKYTDVGSGVILIMCFFYYCYEVLSLFSIIYLNQSQFKLNSSFVNATDLIAAVNNSITS